MKILQVPLNEITIKPTNQQKYRIKLNTASGLWFVFYFPVVLSSSTIIYVLTIYIYVW